MSSPWPFGALTPLSYELSLADPPWAYTMYSAKGYGKSPKAHYATMPDEALLSLPVGHLAAPDCLLVMWAVWPRIDFAMRLMEAWGFRHKTGGAWHKRTRRGRTAFGTGYILRSACEPFLIGTMGAPRYSSRAERNLIDAEAREHSRKPAHMRQIANRLMPHARKCELFAREGWEGADTCGLETTLFAGA